MASLDRRSPDSQAATKALVEPQAARMLPPLPLSASRSPGHRRGAGRRLRHGESLVDRLRFQAARRMAAVQLVAVRPRPPVALQLDPDRRVEWRR